MNCQHVSRFVATPNSIHHGKEVCETCGKFLRWVPKPETEQRRAEQKRLIETLLGKPLSEWERGFIGSIKDQSKLSPKQADKLTELAQRHGA